MTPEGSGAELGGASDPASATAVRLREAAGPLAAEAVARMSEKFAWFRELPPDQRSWVGLVAQSGVTEFLNWLSEPGRNRPDARALAGQVFGDAPPEMARVVSLQQTVDLVRLTVAVVEEHAPELAPPSGRASLREAVLTFSRDVAFATAEVYARAAEQRGAWDARLESLAVDHVLRDEPAELVQSRAAALGWGNAPVVTVLVGSAGGEDVARVLAEEHLAAARAGIEVLAGVQGGQLAVIAGVPALTIAGVPAGGPASGTDASLLGAANALAPATAPRRRNNGCRGRKRPVGVVGLACGAKLAGAAASGRRGCAPARTSACR